MYFADLPAARLALWLTSLLPTSGAAPAAPAKLVIPARVTWC